jgi:hypothetical protein
MIHELKGTTPAYELFVVVMICLLAVGLVSLLVALFRKCSKKEWMVIPTRSDRVFEQDKQLIIHRYQVDVFCLSHSMDRGMVGMNGHKKGWAFSRLFLSRKSARVARGIQAILFSGSGFPFTVEYKFQTGLGNPRTLSTTRVFCFETTFDNPTSLLSARPFPPNDTTA